MIRVAMTSELSQQRNDAITYFTCSIISRHWELFFQNLLLEEVLMVKYGKKWTIFMFDCYLY